MRKLLFLSTALLLLVLLTTCGEKESLFEREKAPVSQEEEYLFSLDDALSYAGKFQLRDENLITKGDVKAVSQLMSVGVGKPDFHIINYTNGGFVIISADKRIPPVIAYSDDSEFDFEGELPPGLQMWMDNVSQHVESKRAENAKPDASTTALWNVFTGNIVAAPPAPTYCSPVGTQYPNYQTITYGPLLTTAWHQRDGYNEALPYMNCTSTNNGRPPVGCVPLAFAQLMRYHQKPSNYNWSSMGPGSSALQNLLKDLGTYFGTNYACDGSGTGTYYLTSVLPNHYGYSSCTSSGYNYNSLYNYISTNKPVLIVGYDGNAGHMWVCDGLELTYDGTCITGNTIQTTLVLKRLHMNWGSANVSYNGYYSENYFNPGTYAFNSNISLYFVTK